jgi:hypothetical protein
VSLALTGDWGEVTLFSQVNTAGGVLQDKSFYNIISNTPKLFCENVKISFANAEVGFKSYL